MTNEQLFELSDKLAQINCYLSDKMCNLVNDNAGKIATATASSELMSEAGDIALLSSKISNANTDLFEILLYGNSKNLDVDNVVKVATDIANEHYPFVEEYNKRKETE